MYYDYVSYLNTIISNQNELKLILNNILLHLDLFVFIFTIYFLYKFISSMIRGR